MSCNPVQDAGTRENRRITRMKIDDALFFAPAWLIVGSEIAGGVVVDER